MHRTSKQDCNTTMMYWWMCLHAESKVVFHRRCLENSWSYSDDKTGNVQLLPYNLWMHRIEKQSKKEVLVLSSLLQPCCIFIHLNICLLKHQLYMHGYLVIIWNCRVFYCCSRYVTIRDCIIQTTRGGMASTLVSCDLFIAKMKEASFSYTSVT